MEGQHGQAGFFDVQRRGSAGRRGGKPGSGERHRSRRGAPATVRRWSGRLSLAVAPGYDLAGFGAERLARRLEVATAGRYSIERLVGSVTSDLSFGDAQAHLALHPGFGFFAGLPGDEGLPAAEFSGWLELGGGQLLWDELAQPFGLKPLLAGHSSGLGLWSNVRLAEVSDLAGLPAAASGLGARVLKLLGADMVAVSAQDLKAALASGRISLADWAGSLPAVAFDLGPLAQCFYQPGLNAGGTAVSLTVARPLWDGLTAADQVIFAACAAEEHRLGVAEAKLHAALAGRLGARAKWPRRQALPGGLAAALAAAARAVVEEVAGHDASCRRIAASYRAHRRWHEFATA